MTGDYEDYESGPFCAHWADPADCEQVCVACGFKCHEHGTELCDCKEFCDEGGNRLRYEP